MVQYAAFCMMLLPLVTLLWRVVQVVHGSAAVLFVVEPRSVVWMAHALSTHPQTDTWVFPLFGYWESCC